VGIFDQTAIGPDYATHISILRVALNVLLLYDQKYLVLFFLLASIRIKILYPSSNVDREKLKYIILNIFRPLTAIDDNNI